MPCSKAPENAENYSKRTQTQLFFIHISQQCRSRSPELLRSTSHVSNTVESCTSGFFYIGFARITWTIQLGKWSGHGRTSLTGSRPALLFTEAVLTLYHQPSPSPACTPAATASYSGVPWLSSSFRPLAQPSN